jgi:hypothetical protein
MFKFNSKIIEFKFKDCGVKADNTNPVFDADRPYEIACATISASFELTNGVESTEESRRGMSEVMEHFFWGRFWAWRTACMSKGDAGKLNWISFGCTDTETSSSEKKVIES